MTITAPTIRFKTLASVLAGIYPASGDMATVLDDVGIPIGEVTLTGKAINDWSDILRQARHHNKYEALLERAHDQYPDCSDLNDCLRQIGRTAQNPTPGRVVYDPDLTDSICSWYMAATKVHSLCDKSQELVGILRRLIENAETSEATDLLLMIITKGFEDVSKALDRLTEIQRKGQLPRTDLVERLCSSVDEMRDMVGLAGEELGLELVTSCAEPGLPEKLDQMILCAKKVKQENTHLRDNLRALLVGTPNQHLSRTEEALYDASKLWGHWDKLWQVLKGSGREADAGTWQVVGSIFENLPLPGREAKDLPDNETRREAVETNLASLGEAENDFRQQLDYSKEAATRAAAVARQSAGNIQAALYDELKHQIQRPPSRSQWR